MRMSAALSNKDYSTTAGLIAMKLKHISYLLSPKDESLVARGDQNVQISRQTVHEIVTQMHKRHGGTRGKV